LSDVGGTEFKVPSFRKSDRNALAPKGELSGIEGTRGAEQYQERLIKTCEFCNAIMIEGKGFVECKGCRALVHSRSPCSVMIDGQATCRDCVLCMFPYSHEEMLALAASVIRPKKFDLARRLGIDKRHLKEIENRMREVGLLNKDKPTRTGLRAYYYLYQILAFEPDVALLISEMEAAMDV
jgi:predicted transcriptional regulator